MIERFCVCSCCFCFFFQAEDCILFFHVTGVQTCALPIFPLSNNIALRTEDVNLPDAFSRYIIDSRSTVSIIQRNPTFPVVVECSPEKLDGWLGLSLGRSEESRVG